MEERTKRIVEAAIELAEDGGFEAVRLRDLAARADVAMGTLYKRFRSKEDILIAVLEYELELVEAFMAMSPSLGPTPGDRLQAFFTMMTEGLCAKENLARAVLRAVASGDHALTERVARFHSRVAALTMNAMCDESDHTESSINQHSERPEHVLVFLVSHVWFAALVGWMGGLHDTETVISRVATAAQWMVSGMPQEARGEH